MLLKVDCLPNAVGKQPSIPLINLGRKWMFLLMHEDDDDDESCPWMAASQQHKVENQRLVSIYKIYHDWSPWGSCLSYGNIGAMSLLAKLFWPHALVDAHPPSGTLMFIRRHQPRSSRHVIKQVWNCIYILAILQDRSSGQWKIVNAGLVYSHAADAWCKYGACRCIYLLLLYIFYFQYHREFIFYSQYHRELARLVSGEVRSKLVARHGWFCNPVDEVRDGKMRPGLRCSTKVSRDCSNSLFSLVSCV